MIALHGILSPLRTSSAYLDGCFDMILRRFDPPTSSKVILKCHLRGATGDSVTTSLRECLPRTKSYIFDRFPFASGPCDWQDRSPAKMGKMNEMQRKLLEVSSQPSTCRDYPTTSGGRLKELELMMTFIANDGTRSYGCAGRQPRLVE